MTLATLAPYMMQASIVLTVATLGLHARRGDVRSLLADHGRLARSLLAMDGVMVLLAVAVALAFPLYPAVKVALVALAVSPVPPLLPKKELKVGGSSSYAVGLLVVSAVVSVVVVPAAVYLVGPSIGDPRHLSANAVAQVVATTVLVPLAVGIVLRRLAPGLVDRVTKPVTTLCTVLFAVAALTIVAAAWRPIASLVGNGTLLAIALFWATGLAAGHLLGGPAREDRVVLALSTASRHPAVAIAAGTAIAPGETRLLAAIVLYLLVGGVLSAVYLRLLGPVPAAAAPDVPPYALERFADDDDATSPRIVHSASRTEGLTRSRPSRRNEPR
jgi:BASS family bile acid:Na+ symporter